MPTIKFQTNVPVELHLRSTEGKVVDSQFGGVQHMFSCDEGAFYVSDTVGEIITRHCQDLGVKAGDLVRITKAEVNRGNGRKGIQWQVTAVLEPQPEPPSELEQKLADSIALAQARKQPQQATVSATPEMLPWQMTLLSQTKALTDVYAAALAHATSTHGAAVKADDVRTFVVTTFINATKQGARNAA